MLQERIFPRNILYVKRIAHGKFQEEYFLIIFKNVIVGPNGISLQAENMHLLCDD